MEPSRSNRPRKDRFGRKYLSWKARNSIKTTDFARSTSNDVHRAAIPHPKEKTSKKTVYRKPNLSNRKHKQLQKQYQTNFPLWSIVSTNGRFVSPTSFTKVKNAPTLYGMVESPGHFDDETLISIKKTKHVWYSSWVVRTNGWIQQTWVYTHDASMTRSLSTSKVHRNHL